MENISEGTEIFNLKEQLYKNSILLNEANNSVTELTETLDITSNVLRETRKKLNKTTYELQECKRVLEESDTCYISCFKI